MSKLKYQYVTTRQLPLTKFCFDWTYNFEYEWYLVLQAWIWTKARYAGTNCEVKGDIW